MEALDVAYRVPEAAIPNPMLRLCIIFLRMGGGLGEGSVRDRVWPEGWRMTGSAPPLHGGAGRCIQSAGGSNS